MRSTERSSTGADPPRLVAVRLAALAVALAVGRPCSRAPGCLARAVRVPGHRIRDPRPGVHRLRLDPRSDRAPGAATRRVPRDRSRDRVDVHRAPRGAGDRDDRALRREPLTSLSRTATADRAPGTAGEPPARLRRGPPPARRRPRWLVRTTGRIDPHPTPRSRRGARRSPRRPRTPPGGSVESCGSADSDTRSPNTIDASPRGPNHPANQTVGRARPAPTERHRDGQHPHHRQAQGRVQEDLPRQFAEQRTQEHGPEPEEGDLRQQRSQVLGEQRHVAHLPRIDRPKATPATHVAMNPLPSMASADAKASNTRPSVAIRLQRRPTHPRSRQTESARAPSQPTTMPIAAASTSDRRNTSTTSGPCTPSVSIAAASASTKNGRASPSFKPLSMFNACRTATGTRGLDTTA